MALAIGGADDGGTDDGKGEAFTKAGVGEDECW